jgi:hypothetical protein
MNTKTQPLPINWNWTHDIKPSTLADTRFRAAPTAESIAVTTRLPVLP